MKKEHEVTHKESEQPKAISEIMKPTSGFEVVRKGKQYTNLSIKGKVVVLNHSDKPLMGSNGEIPVTSQDTLKLIYDASPENVVFVKAPNGYKAEWSKFV